MRFDKYDPVSGGFRAPLGFNVAVGDVGAVIGVGLDANGRLVRGGGATGIKGVICPTEVASAGDVIDCMTDGEIVDLEGFNAGTNVFAVAADGALGTDGAAGANPAIGHTVQAWRLVVRVAR